jgi:predicted O-methyltransferase YrrM
VVFALEVNTYTFGAGATVEELRRARAHTLLRVDEALWTEIDGYIGERLLADDPALDAALADSDAAGLPPIAVTPHQGKLMELLARIRGARQILEIGTLGGYSTIWLARGLEPGGRLVTLEVNPRFAEVAAGNVARAGLGDVVEIRVGPALETLPGLVAEGAAFDLIFIDADKANYPGYFRHSLELSRPGTVIIADNVIRDGRILEEDGGGGPDAANVRGVQRLYELIAAEPRVSADATAIQTVGAKGHDGFAIALVT